MPAQGYRKGMESRSVKAARMYMQGNVGLQLCAERYGVSRQSVNQALFRLRRDGIDVWPEDEVTC